MVTPTEFRMLRLFIEHAGQLLSYNVLLEQLWDCDEAYVDRHTPVSYTHLDVYKRQVGKCAVRYRECVGMILQRNP